MKRKPASMWSLETLGRERLSKYFFMREFLYSEIGNFHKIQNIPENVELTLEVGRAFCRDLLDPLHETFGCVTIRSGYRSPELNRFGNENKLNCARNDYPGECHIWDCSASSPIGGATIVIPWFADQYARGRDWRDLAYWIHDHLPYSEQWYFPKLAAFNLTWEATPRRTISSYIAPRGKLLVAGAEPDEDRSARVARYADFPRFRGIAQPEIPERWSACC
ncbi:hypothetical protein BDE40_1575 [Litoreibacter halocynthiae]|uniref:Peptidase M15-like protein n=2 Tax=Litoreibacter halocynthiae TaxID=1242689 RepID=A0A4R7LGK6_9RHOB|nr:hypothetical protein BDE40_1575 [Litoreibacter halocynthiae]